MKTFKLYQGYRGQRVIKSYQTEDRGEAFSYFKDFVFNELGKDSLYGFVIREHEEVNTHERGE